MNWLIDANGDLINQDHIVRIAVSGSGTDWVAFAKLTVGPDVPVTVSHASRELAQAGARTALTNVRDA